MKTPILALASAAAAAFLAVCLIAGCAATPPTQTALDRATAIARATVFTGVTADLAVHPEHRILIRATVDSLDESLALGRLTGADLARIVQMLPIKPGSALVVSGGLLVWDVADALFGNVSSDAAVHAVGLGIVAGARDALKGSGAPARAMPLPVPPPTPQLTRRL